jgi:putative phosphoesterase
VALTRQADVKLAVISDIHANRHALEAVLADVDACRPDQVVCLGDLVGYGAFPNEVVDLIGMRAIPTVMGNYDQAVGFDLDDCGCAYRDPEDEQRGQASLRWTREHTTGDSKHFLRALPYDVRLRMAGLNLLLVHGSPRRINEYLYEERGEATLRRVAEQAKCDVLLFGHTHIPYETRVGHTLLVNAGSVGKPGDGDRRACYVLVELAAQPVVEFRRVGYDIEAAARAIDQSGLPPHFAELLLTGRQARRRSASGH